VLSRFKEPKERSFMIVRALIFCLASLTADSAHAYIGPGAGISAVGSLLALSATVLLAIVGFVWYPVKRLMKKRRKVRVKAVDKDEAAST
jgi:hypothetical protein